MFQVSHLYKSYRHRPVLTDVSFEAGPGDCIGLVGPNGCGKSTLLQIVAGIIRPDKGSICWQGKNLLKQPSLFPELIGYVPQTNPLFDDMTVLDHLKLWYSGSSHSLNTDLENGFPARLEIGSFLHKKVAELSGGMKKRVSLACTLANQPPLVFLDEPAAALDLTAKAEIREYIRELKESQKVILLATHEEEDFSLCSRLLVFRSGSLTEFSPETPIDRLLAHMEGGVL